MLRESIVELSNMLHSEYPNLSGGSKLDSGLAGKTIDRLTTDPELKNESSSDRPQDRADVKTKINETGYIHFCNAPKSTDEVVIKNRAKTKCENLFVFCVNEEYKTYTFNYSENLSFDYPDIPHYTPYKLLVCEGINEEKFEEYAQITKKDASSVECKITYKQLYEVYDKVTEIENPLDDTIELW